ncbi:preprotein translocase subunit YajC [Singulisphaera sp. GP187]|uniref:preprotein translocase subunit YajC n=1 Tax=Singulisphaera sp. GP187 TaxID=1882752 RepID=UPI00092C293A|nr:preprotein translocase subunit YajC [Singulisphaera sp. GP187]SIN91369.1 preprotein translocase subunit YajC [Singulisphaera sp. GP187]
MPSLLAAIPLLFAQGPAAANPKDGVSSTLNLLPYVLIFVLWGYFLLIRPPQQLEKKRRQMIASLKKNDKIITTGGLYATVSSIDPDQDRIVLRVDDDRGVKLTFSKSVVGRLIEPTTEKSADSA